MCDGCQDAIRIDQQGARARSCTGCRRFVGTAVGRWPWWRRHPSPWVLARMLCSSRRRACSLHLLQSQMAPMACWVPGVRGLVPNLTALAEAPNRSVHRQRHRVTPKPNRTRAQRHLMQPLFLCCSTRPHHPSLPVQHHADPCQPARREARGPRGRAPCEHEGGRPPIPQGAALPCCPCLAEAGQQNGPSVVNSRAALPSIEKRSVAHWDSYNQSTHGLPPAGRRARQRGGRRPRVCGHARQKRVHDAQPGVRVLLGAAAADRGVVVHPLLRRQVHRRGARRGAAPVRTRSEADRTPRGRRGGAHGWPGQGAAV